MIFCGALMPAIIQDNLQWWISGVIVVLGLVGYGFRDVIRLSAGRIWAISSVCFSESVRRKVWLITPLAIIGVIVVSQLQKPMDERDAIRQTIKFCLFATGLLVTITAIILACTNLPREIESRVIYTVVTKPTTRLEIVLGKILGFARVSALILIIMGLFTAGYLHLRSWRFDASIRDRLATADVDPVSRPTLEYYHSAGLLTAREMAFTNDMQIYSRVPQPGSTRRYLASSGEGDVIVPFEVKPADLIPEGVPAGQDVPPGAGGLLLTVKIGAERLSHLPQTIAAPATTQSASATTQPGPPATILVQILDANQTSLFSARELNNGQPIPIRDLSGAQPTVVPIPPNAAQQIYKPGTDLQKPMKLYVQIMPAADGFDYFIDKDPVEMLVPPMEQHQWRHIKPMADPNNGNAPAQAILRGREGTAGQQIRGSEHGRVPVAVYRFNGAPPADQSGDVTFEFKSGIERNSDEDTDTGPTIMSVTAFNRDSGQTSQAVTIPLESNRQSYFKIPASLLKGGNFDIRIQCKSNGHLLGMFPSSLSMVRASQPFDFNLIKSLFIMWLMAILVITVAIFTSTWVSWPTAIVLTLVILLGRWGVEQLGDATQPGIGHMVAQDMGFTDPSKAKVVSTMTEALARGLNILATILPDITKFASSEDIEQGMVVPFSKIADSLGVLLCYGLATLTLAYVRLTYTEVAP
jgi:hypothetical protein